MDMQLTVRISDDIKRGILNLSKKFHLKRSDIVRIALEEFLDKSKDEESIPYKRVKKLIGSISSGIPDLGESHRKHLLKKFRKIA